MTNGNLSPEELNKYKKIFVRHLKDNGIYRAVRKTFMKRNITFSHYIAEEKKGCDVIMAAVDTLWAIASSSIGEGFRGDANVRSSLFMMGILTDSGFKELFEKHVHNFDKAVSDVVRNEISYLFNSSLEDDWRCGRINSEIAEKLNEFFICNGYKTAITSKEQSLLDSCRLNKKIE